MSNITVQEALNAATTESNKRIAELESEVAELKADYIKQSGVVTNQGIEIMELLDTVDELKRMQGVNTDFAISELQADNNRLREALIQLSALKLSSAPHIQKLDAVDKIVSKALSATPAESLQAFENSVIEKCAKVCEDAGTPDINDIHTDSQWAAKILAAHLRALKEVK